MRMNRRYILKHCATLFIVFILLTTSGFGASKSRGKAAFWDKLQADLQLVVPDRKISPAFADDTEPQVKKDLSDTLYWKGREKVTVVTEAELAAFNGALQPALEGKSDEAIAGFETFLKQYPDSFLADYARAAMAELSSETPK